MNEVKYSKKFNVFIADPREKIQISNMDILISSRKIAGYAVFKIHFGWLSNMNPLYEIKQNTINE